MTGRAYRNGVLDSVGAIFCELVYMVNFKVGAPIVAQKRGCLLAEFALAFRLPQYPRFNIRAALPLCAGGRCACRWRCLSRRTREPWKFKKTLHPLVEFPTIRGRFGQPCRNLRSSQLPYSVTVHGLQGALVLGR
jgi:hypothetical protein